MILNEQKYNNKSRLYYHGTDTGSFIIDKRNWNAGFITSNWKYALDYTNNLYLLVGTLNTPLNIFNARSKIDLEKISKRISLSNHIIYILQNEDWFNAGDDKFRENLSQEIENLGFDGYFNFETEDKQDSIGLFNEKSFKIRTSLNIDDCINHPIIGKYIKDKAKEFEQLIKTTALNDLKKDQIMSFNDFRENVLWENDTKYIDTVYNSYEDIYDLYLSYIMKRS